MQQMEPQQMDQHALTPNEESYGTSLRKAQKFWRLTSFVFTRKF
jgi:hypothetical protein